MTQPSPVFELRVVLTADNHEAAVRFYRDVLGLPLIREFDGGSLLAAGQATVEVLSRSAALEVDRIEAGKPGSPAIRLAMEVADAAELAEEAGEGGAARLGGPVDTPWGHTNVRLRTPDGVELTLFTVVREDGD